MQKLRQELTAVRAEAEAAHLKTREAYARLEAQQSCHAQAEAEAQGREARLKDAHGRQRIELEAGARRAEALAAHAAGHERRDAAREWRARQKHEVAAAVRSAKRALSEKASELASAEKELARERREHARERKRLETLRARAEATRKTLVAGAKERATSDGRKGGKKRSIDDAFVRGAERHQGGAKRKARSLTEEEEEEDSDDDEEEDSDAELCGVVLPEDDDAPIISVR